MTYRVSVEEVLEQQANYKKNYPPFYPYDFSGDIHHLGTYMCNILTTQNGQDTDDYPVDDTNKVERWLSPWAGKRSLILGTGTGREVLVAKELGMQATGTTLGSRNVHFGRESLGLDKSEIVECLNENLPYKNEEFDVVGGFQVFEHTMAPMLFLMEIGRVLKDGAFVVLEWPPAKWYSMEDNPHHQVCFTPGQAKALLQKSGFINIVLCYADGSTIPEEDYWRGDVNQMLVAIARKGLPNKDYLQRHWRK